MAEHDPAPRTRAALAAYTGHSGWDAVITALREERVMARLEAAEAVVRAAQIAWDVYQDISSIPTTAMEKMGEALDAWEALGNAKDGTHPSIEIVQPPDNVCPHGHTDIEVRGRWPAMRCKACGIEYQAR